MESTRTTPPCDAASPRTGTSAVTSICVTALASAGAAFITAGILVRRHTTRRR